MLNPTLVHAVEGFLAALFVGTGALKLFDVRGHGVAIARYELLPARAAAIAGAVLPAVEFAAGVALLLRIAVRPALAGMLMLLLGFMLAMAVKIAQRKRVPCGCFGTSNELIGWWPLARNLVLCAGAMLALASNLASPAPSDWLMLAGSGALICIAAAQLSIIARFLRHSRG